MPRTQRSLKKNLTTLTTSSGSTPKKRKDNSPKVSNSRKKELFPHLPEWDYAFIPKDLTKLNKAWFNAEDRMIDHIKRYKLKTNEYTAFHYTGKTKKSSQV